MLQIVTASILFAESNYYHDILQRHRKLSSVGGGGGKSDMIFFLKFKIVLFLKKNV